MLINCKCINYRDKLEIEIALESKIKRADEALAKFAVGSTGHDLARSSKGDAELVLKKVRDTPDC